MDYKIPVFTAFNVIGAGVILFGLCGCSTPFLGEKIEDDFETNLESEVQKVTEKMTKNNATGLPVGEVGFDRVQHASIKELLAKDASFSGRNVAVEGVFYFSKYNKKFFLLSSVEAWSNRDTEKGFLVYVGATGIPYERLIKLDGKRVHVVGRFDRGNSKGIERLPGIPSNGEDVLIYSVNTAHASGTIDAISIVELCFD